MQAKAEWDHILVERFVDNLTQCVNCQLETRNEASQLEIKEFLRYTKTLRLGAFLLPAGIEQLIEKTFHSEVITSFLEDACFDMFGIHSLSPVQYEWLCQSVVNGLAMDGQDDDYCLLPDEVKVTHHRNIYSQIQTWENKILSWFGFRQKSATLSLFLTIKNNPWLILILMFRSIVLEQTGPDL